MIIQCNACWATNEWLGDHRLLSQLKCPACKAVGGFAPKDGEVSYEEFDFS